VADNSELDAASGGDTIATDEISGVHHQKMKMEFGLDGTAIEVSAGNPLPVTDPFLEAATGGVPNRSVALVFGRNPDIDTGSGFEAVWDGGGDYTGFDAVAAETVTVVSTSTDDDVGQSGATGVLLSGLDLNYAPLSEVLALDGTTPVTSVNSYLRLPNVTVTSGAPNVGTITVAQSVTTANVFCQIEVGYSTSHTGVYTVPAGKTAYTKVIFASMGNATNGDIDLQVGIRLFGGVLQIPVEFALFGGGSSAITREFPIPFPLPEKTDLKFMASSSSNNMSVSVGIDFLLIDN